jgi:hypothetical protein
LAVYSNITDCYTRGGGSNQIGKADINIDDNTTVAQFYHKFSNFLTEASTAIDIALKTVRGWTFDIRDLIISVDEIARQCKDKDYWLDPPKDGATEYGIYLKDNNGKNTLWVGIRCSHWHNHGDPISLAVHETNPSWSRKSLELFKLAYTDSQNFEEHSTYSFPLESNYGISVDGLMKTIDTHMAALAE